MFKKLGRLTTHHPWTVCTAWIFAGLFLTQIAPPWDTKAQDDDIHFLPDRCASVRGYLLLEKAFPRDIFASRAIFAIERTAAQLTPSDFQLVDCLLAALRELGRDEPSLQIGNIASYRDRFIGKRLISADKHCTLIQVALGTPFLAIQTRTTVDRIESRLREVLAASGPNLPRLLVTGPAGLGRDLIQAGATGLEGTTIATVILVVVVLLLVYRAPLLALIPLATIAVSVWVSLRLLALMTLVPGIHLVNISKIFSIVILYGAGTDYCLFLISRYREELIKTPERTKALRRSLRAVGGALAASAGTVICGLGMMAFAEFARVRCAGPAIALGLAVALLASLTLTPALLQLLGQAAFWPARAPVTSRFVHKARVEPFWDRISRAVVARPVLIWSIAVLTLLPLVVLGLRVTPTYKSTGELPPVSQSIQGVAAIQRHFTAGEIGPMTVLLVSPTDWSTPAGREVVSHLSRGFALLPNVAEVRSLTQPLGNATQLPATVKMSSKGLFNGLVQSIRRGVDTALEQANRATRDFYVSSIPGDAGPRSVTRLDVVFRSDPFDRASHETMDLIQTWLREELPRSIHDMGGVEAECYGVTVNAHDLAEVTEADRGRINILVLGGIFLILMGLVRKPWLAAYLLATVLLSYFATLGATVLVGRLWSGRPLDQVEWRVPFFLFTILVAVGEDYNILLITRVLQEARRRGSIEGTRRALARTGGTITSCGLIMAGTFATLMLSGLGTLVQIGFALAFGVLLDTFVVRPFLVPAFTLMVWRAKKVEGSHVRRKIAPPQRLAG
jgi:RND superfamily putative drug exporter